DDAGIIQLWALRRRSRIECSHGGRRSHRRNCRIWVWAVCKQLADHGRGKERAHHNVVCEPADRSVSVPYGNGSIYRAIRLSWTSRHHADNGQWIHYGGGRISLCPGRELVPVARIELAVRHLRSASQRILLRGHVEDSGSFADDRRR